MSEFPTFGQDLHPETAARLAALVVEGEARSRADLRDAVADQLRLRSPATRRRVADKLLQRFVEFDPEGRPRSTPLLRLLAALPDSRARLEIAYYHTAETEPLLGALLERLLHPYLVNGRPPRGIQAAQFRAANAVDLFESERALTRHFISAYANSAWGFSSKTTLDRALRMIRRVGVIRTLARKVMGRRLLSFVRVPVAVAPSTFAFALYEEFAGTGGVQPHRLQSGRAAHRFLLEPIQVTTHLDDLRRRGIIGAPSRAAEPRLTLRFPSLDELVDYLSAGQAD